MPDKQNGGAMTDHEALSDRELIVLANCDLGLNLPVTVLDDNAARLVRNRIAELGMNAIRAYQSELAQLVWPNGTPSTLLKGADHFAFSLQHAPARMQMIAALKAKESSNG